MTFIVGAVLLVFAAKALFKVAGFAFKVTLLAAVLLAAFGLFEAADAATVTCVAMGPPASMVDHL